MRRLLALLAAACAACGDVNSCETRVASSSDVCLPPALAPNVTSTIELRELCGPSCTALPGCTAILRNAQVVVDVEQEVCVPTSLVDCPLSTCQQRAFPCKLPPLTAGDWALTVPGAPARILHVREGGVTACRFAADAGVQ